MTIQFNCPNCDAVIAFDDKHCGKHARCYTCGQGFIIPFKDGEKAKKVKPTEEKGESLPGFYRAVFVDSRQLFTTPRNVTGLVFIATAVCCKFFVAGRNYVLTIPGRAYTVDLPLPVGHVLHAAAWGFLFWYYMEIIYSTAFGREDLPDVIVGGSRGFVQLIARSIYTFFVVLLAIELPLLIYLAASAIANVEWPVLFYILLFGGLFLLPMAILTVAVGKDLTLLRPDYLVAAILRGFRPYLVPAVLLGVAGAIQTQAKQYADQGFAAAAWHLLLNLTVQAVILVAMRSIGLFYRHYSCHLQW